MVIANEYHPHVNSNNTSTPGHFDGGKNGPRLFKLQFSDNIVRH